MYVLVYGQNNFTGEHQMSIFLTLEFATGAHWVSYVFDLTPKQAIIYQK